MKRGIIIVMLGLVLAAPVSAAGISGQYVEARTCDIWTGPCFANAETHLAGKHAVMAWSIDQGSYNGVPLDGLSIVAVVSAHTTIGIKQNKPARSVLIVDERATDAQREALIEFARQRAADWLQNVVAIESAPIKLEMCPCKNNSCAILTAGKLARVETRCIYDHFDKVCGNESAFYPPMSKQVKVKAAAVVDHRYKGKALNETWVDKERTGAYIGSFDIR
ncbi:MAG: hypothetical protein KatS3mg105_2180 [Gemmatales bacterium]|nr:MAG: hypothetical protein KatS3mg105_2180 [Gemmatales bacterium]